jgi:hypothetical protein
MKLQYFVLSTTVDAIRMQFDSESMANAVPNAQVTDLQATSNEKLLAYVTSNGYFKQLRDCGFVPNSLFEGKKQKESLRRWKSNLKKFSTVCRASPAMLFNGVPFSTISKIVSEEHFVKDWQKAKSGEYTSNLSKDYFVAWPTLQPSRSASGN